MASFAASVVGIALLLVAVGAPAEQGAPAPVDRGPKFAIPTTRDRIGRIIAPVTLNGRGPFRFVVDTGANHSTVSSALAAALRLTPAANVMLHG
ncbi:MAG TPA: aspartyl protease family protein, partial [Steroidobacteraceae bacterium]